MHPSQKKTASWQDIETVKFTQDILPKIDRRNYPEALRNLERRLADVKNFESHDPYTPIPFKEKRDYVMVDRIPGLSADQLKVFPDGSVVVGDENRISIYKKEQKSGLGLWTTLFKRNSDFPKGNFQLIPGGRILANGNNSYTSIWTSDGEGHWNRQEIGYMIDGCRCMHAMPNGNILGQVDEQLILFNMTKDGYTEQSDISRNIEIPLVQIQGMADGRIYTADDNAGILVWVVKDGVYEDHIISTHAHTKPSMRATGDGKVFYIMMGNQNILLEQQVSDDLSEDSWKREYLCPELKGVEQIELLSEDRLLVCSRNKIFLLNQEDAQPWTAREILKSDHFIRCFAVLPDGRILISEGEDKVSFWDGVDL